jgi:hypothetical protein
VQKPYAPTEQGDDRSCHEQKPVNVQHWMYHRLPPCCRVSTPLIAGGCSSVFVGVQRDLRDELGMNPDVPGRPAITGRQGDAVRDFLSAANRLA